MFSDFGKMLIFIGVLLVIIGLLITFLPKIPFLGKLPGDIRIERKNFTFYFPLATSIIISIILTIIFSLFGRK
ncbi:MAG: hypothetical protein A2043_08170 [Candidatus Schekmanbacteria bacterium GWA2_38_9]|uniref:DUF2905 domain-containing protein n=1 Tax=Candidatus Schekmanbacteria bacterium RIFCSPLOWO2_12_FULL_38_15 TaxID=1817883 RepID=A0A1F7SGY2_9BACT|nr:MAG: hypothetical protein A2043_08170 [Candidatus Schekmanbacteria bacterium GWA2_38_9]OGL50630.1 MAG: hypothetical protein A3H37_02175 [Candidatus Schekmanbacteria bacterium RIFCSPLOWO2_02_FULL_38_14]OGL52494.1 MAG: hypothetical protein A3G31_10935 [Candidatus Schekmanbacteria bacterium RIFCSPLOWO2_12_FULL_38_15]